MAENKLPRAFGNFIIQYSLWYIIMLLIQCRARALTCFVNGRIPNVCGNSYNMPVWYACAAPSMNISLIYLTIPAPWLTVSEI